MAALKPIYVWFAKRWTDAQWKNFETDSDYANAAEIIGLAAEDLNLSAGDGSYFAYRVTGDQMDNMLKLSILQLPQLLFSTPIDPDDPKKGQMFLAKLVQGQINRKNVVTILKTVRAMEPQKDPGSKVSFYNPSLGLPAVGISNTAEAPGTGYMIGINPVSESLEVNRYGQQLLNLFNNLTKLIPWVVGGVVAYELTKK